MARFGQECVRIARDIGLPAIGQDFAVFARTAPPRLGVLPFFSGGHPEPDAAVIPQGATAAAAGNLGATPIRPPAAPLAVRGPYVSTWLPATVSPATWQEFWQGHTTAMGGIARIDGVSYLFMGDAGIILTVPNGNQGTPSTVQGFERALQQTGLQFMAPPLSYRVRALQEGAGIGADQIQLIALKINH